MDRARPSPAGQGSRYNEPDMDDVTRTVTAAGRTLYTFPVQAFPQLAANITVISDGEHRVLVDCGSGMDRSNEELLAGLARIGELFGEPVDPAGLDAILITHGHIDHFGGLSFLRGFSQAPIGVHPLDRRVLSHYEERVVVASRGLERFLKGAGMSGRHLANLMQMYLFAKGVYRSTPVQFALEEGRPLPDDLGLDGVAVYHVPGHCPGQVCLQVDDILLTADHVLSRTTPHQAPESITNNMGLGHYLASLEKIEQVGGVRLALGGHELPMEDLTGRIGEIRDLHDQRLNQVLEICEEPRSIAQISQELFGQVSSYHVLLALEETGAHLEYLYQRGEVLATNLDEIENDPEPVIVYQRCGGRNC
jgi:glyoxylase-like metal-dependent hydrolase (beta-lactamase superfamily II)